MKDCSSCEHSKTSNIDYEKSPCAICETARETHMVEPEIIQHKFNDKDNIKINLLIRIFANLNTPMKQKIALEYLRCPDQSIEDISKSLGIKKQLAHYHIKNIRNVLPEFFARRGA